MLKPFPCVTSLLRERIVNTTMMGYECPLNVERQGYPMACPPTVLCIDDFMPGLETRKAFLEQFGFMVLVANNGLDGLRLLGEHAVDVVVLDYHMPVMSGEEVALRIRHEFGKLPILLLSGCGREIPGQLKKMVNSYITKGDPPAMLIAALDELTTSTTEQRRVNLKTRKIGVAGATSRLYRRAV